MSVEVREAEIGDLPIILELYSHLHARNTEAGDAVETFERILAASCLHLYLLEDDGIACATCYLNVIDNLTYGASPYALIENVVTDPAYRRRGFARTVLRHALDRAWSEGCYKVMLLTGRQENIGFYEACGFDPQMRRPGNPRDSLRGA